MSAELPGFVNRQLLWLLAGDLEHPRLVQELLQAAACLPETGWKLLLHHLLQSSVPASIQRSVWQQIDRSCAAEDLVDALLSLPAAAPSLEAVLQQTLQLPAQQQVEVALAVAGEHESNRHIEGRQLALAVADQHLLVLHSWPELLRQRLAGLLSSSNSPELSPEAVQALLSACQGASVEPAHARRVLMNSSSMAGEGAKDLAEAMEELGPSCTASQQAMEDLLQQVSVIDEAAVAQALAMMARTHASLGDGSSAGVAAALSALGAGLGSGQGDGLFAPGDQGWDVNLAVNVLRARHPGLQWKQLAHKLDCPGFDLPDSKAFQILLSGLRHASGQGQLPLEALVGRIWRNQPGQASLLRHATAAPPEVVPWPDAQPQQPPLEGLSEGRSPHGTANQAWRSMELMGVLCALGEGGQLPAVLAAVEAPRQQCPEVLLLGLAGVDGWSAMQGQVCDSLAVQYLAGGHPDSAVVLRSLRKRGGQMLLQAMLALHRRDAGSILRILEVCRELHMLESVLNAAPVHLALDLGMAADAAGVGPRLDQWAAQRVSSGAPFLQALLLFLAGTAEREQAARPGFSLAFVAMLLRTLQAQAPQLPAEVGQELDSLQARMLEAHPALAQLQLEPDAPLEVPREAEDEANRLYVDVYEGRLGIDDFVSLVRQFKASSDSQQRAACAAILNTLWEEFQFFEQYPEPQLQISAQLFGTFIHDGLVQDVAKLQGLQLLLGGLGHPPDSKTFKFALAAVRVLSPKLGSWRDWGYWADFCKFLAAKPGLREAAPDLAEAAEQVVQEHAAAVGDAPLADGISSPLSGALSPQGALQQHGSQQQAADAMQKDQVVAQPSAQQGQPAAAPGQGHAAPAAPEPQAAVASLLPPVSAAASAAGTPQAPSQAAGSAGRGAAADAGVGTPATKTPRTISGSGQAAARTDPNRAFQAINSDTLEAASLEADFTMPPDLVQSKVGFLINNLSKSNLDTKVKELAGLITAEHWPWFANYMVVKRAAQEPNYHALYLELLETVDKAAVNKYLAPVTYKYIKVLLASSRIRKEVGERSLLKNLGSWLGQLTIKQNKSILQRDLDVKGLMFEAYEQGKMIAVLPFINRILEHCKDTRVYKPSNPWLKGILALAAEIYALDKLKLHLKFDIETMFKNQGLSIETVTASNELHKHARREGVENPDFAADKPAVTGGDAVKPLLPAAKAAAVPPPAMPAVVPPAPQPAPAASAPPTIPREAEAKPLEPAAPGYPAEGGQGLFANLHANVHINQNLALLEAQLQLKRVVPVAVDRAIVEIITPVVERSVTIACMTTQELIVKDFAVEPDEQRMRSAAHLMVSSLAGSLALVTSKEPLRVSLMQQLRNLLQAALEAGALEQTLQIITSDNLELGCQIIEKAATDKAIRDIDERLAAQFQARARARALGQTFVDPTALGVRFPATLPDALRRLPEQLSQQQQRVYEDFARIPRGQRDAAAAVGGGSQAGAAIDAKMGSTQSGDGDSVDWLRLQDAHTQLQRTLDTLIAKSPADGGIAEQADVNMVVKQHLIAMTEATEESQLRASFRLFRHLYEGIGSRLHVQTYIALLESIHAKLLPRLPAELTRWWTTWFAEVPDERRFARDQGEALVRASLFSLPDLDSYLARRIGMAQGSAAQELAVHLVRTCLVAEGVVTAADLFATLDVLARMAQRTSGGTAVLALVEQARQVASLRRQVPSNKGDPQGLREQVAVLFDEWAHLSEDQPAEKVHAKFVGQLQAAGFLKGDDLTDRFLRTLTELAVTHCLSGEAGAVSMRPGLLYFVAIDAYVRLLTLLINAHGGGAPLLARTLGMMVMVLQRDAEQRGYEFNSRPYFRICLGFICELAPGDPNDASGFGMLASMATTFQHLQPLRVPGFAFAWLELVSHRSFMPKLLLVPSKKGWPYFQRLLVALLRFLEPYLRNAELTDAVRLLYKGTLRVLLVLLHDFPEFLCEYHFQLCDVVPPSCIQMRNLILSAFPRNMRLPDPFTPNLKVDLLPEITQTPKFLPEPDKLLPKALKAEVDSFLKNRQPASLLVNLKQRLVLAPQDAIMHGTRYNCPLLNALVFYVGIQAVASTAPQAPPSAQSPAMDIYQRLAAELDTEGRYLFLNALANQLRYPNNHTHHFSCVLLFLFVEAQQEIVQEQITRVLLERLIVNRPHPWGLLITFIELIKNPRYNFWSHQFTHCAAEIERLFESVAKSCMGPRMGEDDGGLHQQQLPAAAPA